MSPLKYSNKCLRAIGPLLAAAAGLAVSMPALADPEIDELRKELAEQRALIRQLQDAQQAKSSDSTKETAQPSTGKIAGAAVPSSSGFNVYGIADVSIARTNSGFGQKMSFGSGGLASSRLGVKGYRALGNGLEAVGVAEAGVLIDTGSVGNGGVVPGINNTNASTSGISGTGNQIFSRQIYAGLSSTGYGSLTIGRQYAGSFILAGSANAMGTGLYGYSAGFLPIAGMPTRVNNSVVYYTPTFSGFTGQLLYTTGSENNVNSDVATSAATPTKTNDKAGRGLDGAVTYAKGQLFAGVSAWDVYTASYATGETGLAKKKGFQVGASYDFGVIKIFADYVNGKTSGNNYESVTKTLSKNDGWTVSASAPFGKSKVVVDYTKFDDKSLLDRDGQLLGIGYIYALMSDTRLYASWGRLINNRNASYSLPDAGNLVGNVTTAGVSPSGTMVGIDFSF